MLGVVLNLVPLIMRNGLNEDKAHFRNIAILTETMRLKNEFAISVKLKRIFSQFRFHV